MALPQAPALRAGALFCYNNARLLLNICVPREITAVRDELCRSVLLQDALLRISDPTLFPRAGPCFVEWVSVVQVLLFSPCEPKALEESLLFFFSGDSWVCGSSHNAQHSLQNPELWDTCVLRLESVWWYKLSAFFSCLKRVLSDDMKW